MIVSNNFTVALKSKHKIKKAVLKGNIYYCDFPVNTSYTLELGNNNELVCDVRIMVKEVIIGTWRINPHTKIEVNRIVYEGINSECPFDNGEYFVSNKYDNIRITFFLEKRHYYIDSQSSLQTNYPYLPNYCCPECKNKIPEMTVQQPLLRLDDNKLTDIFVSLIDTKYVRCKELN